MSTDLYRVLEVKDSAAPETIHAAYRRLVFMNHPDRNPGTEAAARTAEITSAYRILGDPQLRRRYDRERAEARLRSIPRAILGTGKLTLYDLLPVKPRHGHIEWEPGIWSHIAAHFADCQERHCLVLLQIDPKNNHQVYQHGDPGPWIEINPNGGEFRLLKPWLDSCHDRHARS